jgi:hypothetical protein
METTVVLAGLRMDKDEIKKLRRQILRLAEIRFGPPDAARRATIEAITERERLERLSAQLLTAASWDERLAEA